jgi:hypothetical protein
VAGVIKCSDDVSVGVVCIFSPGTRLGPIQRARKFFCTGVGRRGREAVDPSNGEVEDAWSSTSIASYVFMVFFY